MPHKDRDPEQQFQLPGTSSKFLTEEIDEEFLQNLDQELQRIEQRQLEVTLGRLADRGFLESGQTFKDVATDVLGPSIQRRTAALLPLARESQLLGRQERLGEIGFQRQRQLGQEAFQRRLKELDIRQQLQRDILSFEREGQPGFFDKLGGAFATGLGKSLGTGVGKGIGAFGFEAFGIDPAPLAATEIDFNVFQGQAGPRGF